MATGGGREGAGWPWAGSRSGTAATRGQARALPGKCSFTAACCMMGRKLLRLSEPVALPVREVGTCPNGLPSVRKRKRDGQTDLRRASTESHPPSPGLPATPRFTEEEGETQRGATTCPKSQPGTGGCGLTPPTPAPVLDSDSITPG